MISIMERIIIENFGGLDKLDIELNKINVFIGKQASGKSVTAKLLFFFKEVYKDIFEANTQVKSKQVVNQYILDIFCNYFPPHTWGDKPFVVKYSLDEHFIRVLKVDEQKLKIEYSDSIKELFTIAKKLIKQDKERFSPKDEFDIYQPNNYHLERQYVSMVQNKINVKIGYSQLYIPAGRSFFANLQNNIFSFLSNNKSIDPFLVRFGAFYENIKPIVVRSSFLSILDKKIASLFEQLSQDIINGVYLREDNQDFLLHDDKRKINVSFVSSGQQEILPLVLMLRTLVSSSSSGGGTTIYIEEPEAHLFPRAQKKIVELLTLVASHSQNKIQLVITTHSPYILTSFNNLAQAGVIKTSLSENNEKLNELYQVIDKELILDPNHLSAFALKDRTGLSIIDDETSLIHADYLDSISEEIAEQFDHFLNLME